MKRARPCHYSAAAAVCGSDAGLLRKISRLHLGTVGDARSWLQVPFDKIEIDRNFVSDLSVANVDALAVVRSVAQLGVSLGMATTAEGAETREQVEHVRAEGCTEMQSYFICPPSPPKDIERLISTQCRKSASAASARGMLASVHRSRALNIDLLSAAEGDTPRKSSAGSDPVGYQRK